MLGTTQLPLPFWISITVVIVKVLNISSIDFDSNSDNGFGPAYEREHKSFCYGFTWGRKLRFKLTPD